MNPLRSKAVPGILCAGALALGLLVVTGCDQDGSVTDSAFDGNRNPGTIDERNLSAVAGPSDPSRLQPIERVPRAQFGQVPDEQFVTEPGPITDPDSGGRITAVARANLFFPSLNDEEADAITEGLNFFTFPHTAQEGLGPVANQIRCLGCHLNSGDAVTAGGGEQLVTQNTHVSRASRSSPTDFRVTRFDLATGGGITPGIDSRDISSLKDPNNLNDGGLSGLPGVTNAFTIFGDFSPSAGTFFPLDFFSGFVQHVRPSLEACVPDPIPPIAVDPLLQGGVDPTSGVSALGVRRTAGERAGPPYIGRGLMEAIYQFDIIGTILWDPEDRADHVSSLDVATDFPECTGDCVSGRHNENTTMGVFVGSDNVIRMGRFGLRAAGPTLLQFVTGGAQGELGFTNEFIPNELNNNANVGRSGCADNVADPELRAEAILSCRNLIRMTPPPEFGTPLLNILSAANPAAPRANALEASVLRGMQLFGIDPVAFANRTVAGRLPVGGDDGRDPHAINRQDQGLNCVGCHTPIHATGESPSEVGARHLSHRWAHVFSDLLIHDMGNVNAERIAQSPRYPFSFDTNPADRTCVGGLASFDISRNLADDTLPGQGTANGAEWRTYPLWGMGKTGSPFLHDARVFLSNLTVNRTPASTVFTDSTVTNQRRCIQTFDDAIHAAIELHDLPAPDDALTPGGAATPTWPHGCPVPRELTPSGANAGRPLAGGQARIDEIIYPQGATEVCPPYLTLDANGVIVQGPPVQALTRNRSEARETMRRFRRLTPQDQQAVIDFLKQL